MSTPLLRKKSVLAAKIETTVGTAETLAAADAAYVVYDVDEQVDAAYVERPSQGTMSKLPGVVGARGGTITFSMEITGDSGWADVFLPSCGMPGTLGAYAVKSGAPQAVAGQNRTITIGVYRDGIVKTFAGCMGNMKVVGEAGKPIRADFEYKGVWVSNADAALLVDTPPTDIGPRVANGTFTLGGVSTITGGFELDLGNNVILREDITTGGGTSGYLSAVITDRNVTGTWQRESALVATRDDYGIWEAGTAQALSIVVGGTAGNILTFAGPAVQFRTINQADKDGLVVDDYEMQFCRSAADDDEFTITQS